MRRAEKPEGAKLDSPLFGNYPRAFGRNDFKVAVNPRCRHACCTLLGDAASTDQVRREELRTSVLGRSAGYSALFVTPRVPPTTATTRLPSIGIVFTLEGRLSLLAEAASLF